MLSLILEALALIGVAVLTGALAYFVVALLERLAPRRMRNFLRRHVDRGPNFVMLSPHEAEQRVRTDMRRREARRRALCLSTGIGIVVGAGLVVLLVP
jgi:hypothetical protein